MATEFKYNGIKVEEVKEVIFQYETTHANTMKPAGQFYNVNTQTNEFIAIPNTRESLFEKYETYYLMYIEGELVKISNGNKLIWRKK